MPDTPSHILALTRSLFRQEAEDLLSELDSAMLQLEASPDDGPALHRAFRVMHTLKGSGATAGFHDIASMVHGVEDLLNGARDGRLRVTAPMIDLLLCVGDLVRRMLYADGDGAALVAEGETLTSSLRSHAREATSAAAAPPPTPPAAGLWRVRFAPRPEMLRAGFDPAVLLEELMSLGRGAVRVDDSRLRACEEFDPEACYLAWEVQLATARPKEFVEGIFLFVEDLAEVRVEAVEPDDQWVLPPDVYFAPRTLAAFRDEVRDDLADAEAALLALEASPHAPEHVNRLQRALHNAKGLCGLLLSDTRRAPPRRHPARAMGALCHAAEDVVVAATSQGGPDDESCERLLSTVDALKSLLGDIDLARESWPEALLASLGARPSRRTAAPPSAARPMTAALLAQCAEVLGSLTRGGDEPDVDGRRALARALSTLARAAQVEGAAGLAARAQALLAGADDAPWAPWSTECRAALDAGDAATEAATEAAAEARARASAAARGRTVSLRAPREVDAPPKAQAAEATSRSVRVEQAKLDALMSAVNELLVAKNALPMLVARAREVDRQTGKEVKETVDRIAHIADDLQDAMRHIRMMPIRSVFQRFPRMIRDLARAEQKQVQLIIAGEETELDKTVLEQIGDPLVHLVRNAVDHGLEGPEARVAAGKAAMGTVGLEVTKEGSHVVIRVSDDGRGMDPARIRAKAVEKGLLTPHDADALSDARALELVFLPGFSTAETLTDISGRGVGMDVVQSNVRALHGTVSLSSEPGRGSVVSIRLPSSLMVSKGMLVGCASELYVLPIEGVREMVKIQRAQLRRVRGVTMAHVRGAVCPVFALSALLGLDAREPVDGDDEAPAAIVVTRQGPVAVVVDRLVAEIDVVVKPLREGLDPAGLFQGATILGDGRVALLLDVARLDGALDPPRSDDRDAA